MSTNYTNSNIDTNYTNSYATNQSILTHPENDVKRSLSATTTSNNYSNKKHVKFSKSVTMTKKSSSKKWRSMIKPAQPDGANNNNNNNTMTASRMKRPAPEEGTYFYYVYNETPPAINDEQLQQQANIAGNYFYYYTIDGTSDANYNEFLIQQAGKNENYNSQRIISNSR